MDKHTPTPWKKFGYCGLAKEMAHAIAHSDSFYREADRDFALKAVNSHAALTEAVRVLSEALEFYSQECRYQGGNQMPVKGDKYQPPELPYMLDVTRDWGNLASAALTQAKELLK